MKEHLMDKEVEVYNYFPFILKRITALPMYYLSKFTEQEMGSIYKDVKSLNKEIEIDTDYLVDLLHIEIKKENNVAIKRKLINFRRDVYNNRLKATEKHRDEIVGNNQLYDVYIAYYNKSVNRKKLQEKLISLYESRDIEERKIIHDLFNTDINSISKSIKFIQPHIYKKLDKYLNTSVENHNSKLKKMDITLAKIISRAITKTSPFSTLTHSQFSYLKSNTQPAMVQHTHPIKTYSKINETIILLIFDKILQDQETMELIEFRLIPTLNIEGDNIFWTTLTNGNEQTKANGKVYKTMDRLVSLKLSPLINDIFQNFKSKTFNYLDFVSFLEDRDYSMEKVKQVFNLLYNKDFIIKNLSLPQNSDSIIYECIRQLEKLNTKISNSIKDQLYVISDQLKELDELDYHEQYRQFVHVGKLLDNLLESLNIDSIAKSEMIYQDAVINEINRNESVDYKKVNVSFSLLMKFINIFNTPYLIQLLIAEEFKKEFNYKKVNASESWEAILQIILDNVLKNMDIFVNQGKINNKRYDIAEINQILDVKEDFLTDIINKINSADFQTEEINLSKSYIEGFVERIPNNLLNKRQSNAMFLQKYEDKVVLNHIYEGNLIYFSRFLKLMPDIQSSNLLTEYIDSTIKDYNYCDIHTTYGFNANSRMNVTGKKIQLLNTPDIGAPQDDLSEYNWMDSSFKVNEKTNELDIFINDEKINIGFFGSLIPMALPGIASAMSLLSSNAAVYTGIDKIILSLVQSEMSDDDNLQKIPRIIFNKDIIISRKKWLLRTEVLRKYFNKDKIEIYEMFNYFNENKLPFTFFTHNFSFDEDLTNRVKPQYIDITSPTFMKLFKRILEDNELIVIEEVLPDINSSSEHHVTEDIIEITKKGR